jgi:endonuclease/exonuclease/phosphatase family metal-dependent hydrolase
VMGDLNDTEYSATTTILAGPGGSEIGTPGFAQKDQHDGYRLWNLGLAIDPANRFSRTYEHRPELIDHIFASHALVQNLGEVTTLDIGAHSIGDEPAAATGRPASDHRPIRAELNPQPLPP